MKKNIYAVLAVSLLLAVGLVACGGGGGGGGGSTNLALQSPYTVQNQDIMTDGQWIVWTGRQEGIVMVDSEGGRALANGLEGLQAHELAFDGQYLAVRAIDSTQAQFDSTQVGHIGIYYYDTSDSSPSLRTIALTDDVFEEFQDMAIGDGILAFDADCWIGTDDGLYVYDMNTRTGPVKVSEDVAVGTGAHAVVSGGLVAWDDGAGIWVADVSSLSSYSASDLTELSTAGFDPKIDGTIVCWEDNTDVWCYDLTDDATGAVNITGSLTNNAYDPDISGTTVVFERYDGLDYEIYVADVSDLSTFDGTLGTGDVQQLTNNTVADGDARVAGGYVAWVGGSDDEVYATDLSAGLSTAIANIVQVSTGFAEDYSYHDESENWYDQYFVLDSQGNVFWTEFDEEGDTSEWYELAYMYNIADDVYVDTHEMGFYVRIKQAEIVDGKVVGIVREAFDRIYAKKAGGGEPKAISPAFTRIHEGNSVDLDSGIVTWAALPGFICDSELLEIYYADLNSGDNPQVVQVTYDDQDDRHPVVDATAGIILWEKNEDDIYYHWIGEESGVAHFLIDSSGGNVRAGDGLVTVNYFGDILLWDTSMPAETMTDITGSVSLGSCPVVKDGVIAFLASDWRSIYYYDTGEETPALRRVNETHWADNNHNFDIGNGVIVFYGFPSTSSAGTDTVYVYNLGDDTDVLDAIYEAEDPSNENIHSVRADGSLVSFAANIYVDSYDEDNELFTYRVGAGSASRVTDDRTRDADVAVGGSYVVWSRGGATGWVYAIQP